MTATLGGCGVHDVRISRIQHDVGDAGVLADLQYRLPRLTAVGRLVQPPIAAGGSEWSLRRNPDHVAVARVDRDPTDLFRMLEANAFPRPPRVGALEHALAGHRAPEIRVLSSREPHDVRVLGI